jgi:2-polyprenyl-6-hydroxyphenyl methylase/3-demethylubiquinone-9 3-methyltransferase
VQPPTRARNDVRQYDDLAQEWWPPRGRFAMLHWIAAARARLVPPAPEAGGVLVDLACGAGLFAEHAAALGYRHIGFDLSTTALPQARDHGVLVARADVLRLPLPDAVADVVTAGEILEHVTDLPAAVAEACRVLRPGGTLVIDTIARTRAARVVAVTVAEAVPGGAPKGIHDPALFVDRAELRRLCAAHGVPVRLRGLRPSLVDAVLWLLRRREFVRMVPTWSTSVLFQGHGTKEGAPG